MHTWEDKPYWLIAGHITKVRRCGPKGTQFKVVVGTEIKKGKSKKENSNAAE